MDIQIKLLEPPYPYKELTQLLKKIYYQEYRAEGTLIWSEPYMRYYFDSYVNRRFNREFVFGAFYGQKLVGTLCGHWDLIRFENRIDLSALNLGLMTVDPDYRRQGIAIKMLSKLIQLAEKKNIDFLMAFPEKDRYGDKLLQEHFGFIKYDKTKHFVKIMEKQGLLTTQENITINPILGKIAGLFSHIPDLEEPPGVIRSGAPKDLDKTLNLINSNSSRVPLSTVYTEDGLTHIMNAFNSLKERFGAPWGHNWVVLEQNGEIHATICARVEKIAHEIKGNIMKEFFLSELTSLAFHEAMSLEEKKQFLSYILRKIHSEVPEVCLTHITTVQHEPKVFKKLKFVDDSGTFFLYIKPLTRKSETLYQYSKFKEYFLEYYR